jgi:hypothetical protein
MANPEHNEQVLYPQSTSVGRWLTPALFGLGSAMGMLALWLTLSHFGAPLGKLGWPFSDITSIALIMGVNGVVVGRALEMMRVRRAAASWDPVEENSPSEDQGEPSEPVAPQWPAVPLFANLVAVDRRRTHHIDGTTIEVFDLTTETSDGDGGTTRHTRTIAMLPVEGLPSFELRPRQPYDRVLRWAGLRGLEFDAPAHETLDGKQLISQFTSSYRITLATAEALMTGTIQVDETPVRRLFPLRVMQAMLRRSNWHIQCFDGYLACWEGIDAIGPKRREALVKDAIGLRKLLLEAQRGEAGEPLAAPASSMSVQRQAARFQTTLLGGVLGCFTGFFAAGLLQVGEVFGPEKFTAIFPISILAGIFLGVTVGRLLPLKQPLLRKPADARREKVVGCAVLAGLFGGFFGGAILGIVLTEWMGLAINAHKPRMMWIFGYLGAGALLGPILLGVATNYLYLWIFGSGESVAKGPPDKTS